MQNMKFASIYQVLVVLIIFQLKEIATTGEIYKTVYSKQYYIDYDEKYTWFEALHECSKLNMTLVAIESTTKSQQINMLLNETSGKTTNLWLGGFRVYDQDSLHYIWLATGQPFNNTLWSENIPNFCNNDEYCLKIDANMEWTDDSCRHTNGFICEYHNTELRAMDIELEMLQKELKEQEMVKEMLRMEILEQEKLRQKVEIEKEKLRKLEKLLERITENENKQQNLFQDRQHLQQELQKEQLQLGELIDQLKADNGMTTIYKSSNRLNAQVP